MAGATNINDVLDGHVGLEVECVDRLYLNAYMPNLQVGGQVAVFMTQHLDNPVASPAIVEQIGGRFRRNVAAFARDNDIPVLHLKRPDRTRFDDHKLDHVRPHLDRAERAGRLGVVAIVGPQGARSGPSPAPTGPRPRRCAPRSPRPSGACRRSYLYILDPDFGPGLIKICTYLPYPAKVWLNGHEWAKRQADKEGIAFTPLANSSARTAIIVERRRQPRAGPLNECRTTRPSDRTALAAPSRHGCGGRSRSPGRHGCAPRPRVRGGRGHGRGSPW